jgi:hypothetical protein
LDSDFLSNLDDLTRPSHQGADDNDEDDDDDTGTVDPNELHENSALWKSLWSQGRGILNTNRHVDTDDLSEDEDHDEDYEDGKTDEKTDEEARTRRKSEVISLSRARKIKVCHSVIPSSHRISCSSLKDSFMIQKCDLKINLEMKYLCEFFDSLIHPPPSHPFHRRVYDLLSSMMYAPVSKTEDAEDSGISDLDRSELQVIFFSSSISIM